MELAADLTPDGLRDVLAELGERVAPTVLARERTLPVHAALSPLFPDGGLLRGTTLACVGGGASTLAMTMARDALIGGAWLALVDLPAFGPDAANELGLPLERMVRIDTSSSLHDEEPIERRRRWFDAIGAAIDGFDLLLVGVPSALQGDRRPAAMRSLVARLQQRGSVIIALGATGSLPIDVTYRSTTSSAGLGRGHGVIGRRRVDVIASGRRQPNPLTAGIDLDVVGRRVALAPAPPLARTHEVDPSATVLAEMLSSSPVEPGASAARHARDLAVG